MTKPPVFEIEGGHRAGAVDAHKPVGLAPAGGGVGESPHLFVGAQAGEALADGLRGHALEPEPLDGLSGAGIADEVAEDEFALAPGIARVDQAIDVLATEEALDGLEAVLGLLAGLEFEVGRDDGKGGEGPLAAAGLEFPRGNRFRGGARGRR
ncbi:MAG: hypothetical protein M5U12_07410 [Verrucomicrobia bacterium]|nr:hypothetical protein [Verrucomicrobiota bacterium]